MSVGLEEVVGGRDVDGFEEGFVEVVGDKVVPVGVGAYVSSHSSVGGEELSLQTCFLIQLNSFDTRP
jgi:hypothetical protein